MKPLLLLVLLAGCGGAVTDKDIERAATACAQHRGVSKIHGHFEPAGFGFLRFECNDNTTIEQHRNSK